MGASPGPPPISASRPRRSARTIRGLETRLGARLLNRTTRSVAPTDAGTRLLERLLPAMAEFDAAVADLKAQSGTPSGLLRINCPRTAAIHLLAPLTGPFLAAYPDITLDIITEEKLVDIVATRFDAGIRLGEKVEQDMVAVKLGGDLESWWSDRRTILQSTASRRTHAT